MPFKRYGSTSVCNVEAAFEEEVWGWDFEIGACDNDPNLELLTRFALPIAVNSAIGTLEIVEEKFNCVSIESIGGVDHLAHGLFLCISFDEAEIISNATLESLIDDFIDVKRDTIPDMSVVKELIALAEKLEGAAATARRAAGEVKRLIHS